MRIGFSPIAFNNEDLPCAGERVPCGTILDAIGRLGYQGTERGAGFPEDPAAMRKELAARRLTMVSGWCDLAPLDPARREADAEKLELTVRWLARCGAQTINLALAWTRERRAVAGRANERDVPRLTAEQWERVGEALNAAAGLARREGIGATFHPHVGTHVETLDEIDALCRVTDEGALGLCLDLGHTLYAGADPIAALQRYARRVRYIHVKDVDARLLAGVIAEAVGFEEALGRCVFTELGRGMLDLAALRETLAQIGYDGWLMVEQDTTRLSGEEAARDARAALQRAGLWR